jgi:hypothetical protein
MSCSAGAGGLGSVTVLAVHVLQLQLLMPTAVCHWLLCRCQDLVLACGP